MKLSGGLLVALATLALLGPALTTSPLEQDHDNLYRPPSAEHWLGTDALGRDVLARTLHASRFSLVTAAAGVSLTLFVGALAGTLSGLLGGRTDRAMMRVVELFTAFPALYLVAALRNLLPDHLDTLRASGLVIVALALVGWCSVARFVRGQVLQIRESEFVLASIALGARRRRLVLTHVLRALYPMLLVQAGVLLPYFLLGEVTLSYLGFGLAPPGPSFGNLLAPATRSLAVLGSYWWTWMGPASVLTLAAIGANLLLEAMRRRYSSSSEAVALEAAGDGAPAPVRLDSWATSASRFWSRSTRGSKHLRHRAS